MFDSKLASFKEVPVDEDSRVKTDVVCLIFSTLYFVGMFVAAFVLLNQTNYYLSNYPTDSDNRPCAYGPNDRYQFVYFPNPADITTRVCLNSCPTGRNARLICNPNSVVASCSGVAVYSTVQAVESIGGFCWPTDPAAQDLILKNANINKKYGAIDTYKIIGISLAISFGVGLLWILFVQLFPRVVAPLTVIMAALILLAGGLLLLLDPSSLALGSSVFWVVTAVVFFMLGVFFILEMALHFRRSKLTSQFLAWGAQFTHSNCQVMGYVVLFILATVGLLVLVYFQHVAFLSASPPSPSSGEIYLKLPLSPVLLLLNIIELVWGIQILKDAFNFLISGLSAQWYTLKPSSCSLTFKRLCTHHLGSVVAGAFLNAFFNIFNFLFQSIKCYPDGPCGLCAAIYQTVCCCADLFDLVRTDVYSYINLTGITYCNAARNCDHLINTSKLFSYSQSLLYFYRVAAYVFTVGVIVLVCSRLQQAQLGVINLTSLTVIALLAFCTLSYFVDFHANAAEGLQVAYLIERTVEGKTNMANFSEFKQKIKEIEGKHSDYHSL